MQWSDFDWRSALKTIAPTVASIFGTPLAGAGVAALLEAIFPGENNGLSTEQAEEKLANAVKSGLSPEQYVALKQADYDFQKHCADIGLRLEEISAADVASARARDIAIITAGRFNTRANVMLICAVAGLVLAMGILVTSKLLGLDESGQIVGALIMLVGNFTTFIGQAFGFEFGSTRGGQAKTDALVGLAASAKDM